MSSCLDLVAFKVLVVGEYDTGKTCLIRRYVHNIYTNNCRTTIGVDFALKILPLIDSKGRSRQVTLQLWDIAGQERYGKMTRVYYQGASAAVVVYDCARPDSLTSAIEWKKDIDHKVFLPDGNPIPCLLVAHKCDLLGGPGDINEKRLDKICSEHGFIGWTAASAKENINVNKLYETTAREVLINEEKWAPADPEPVIDYNTSFCLQHDDRQKPKKRLCCSS